MYLDLKKDIRTLWVDTTVFQEDLETTRSAFSDWCKTHRINESGKITERVKKLESDLIIMQVDCITLMGQTYQGHGTWNIFNLFYLIFFTLDSLLNELKKMRARLGSLLIYPNRMKLSDINWDKAMEIINQIHQYLLAGLDLHNGNPRSTGYGVFERYAKVGCRS